MILHKKAKRAISLLCAVSMIFSLVVFPVNAVEENTLTAATSDTVTQGERESCRVGIASTAGLASLEITVKYDSAKVSINGIENSADCTSFDSVTEEECIRVTYAFDGEGEDVQTQLFSFEYQAADDAETGETYFEVTADAAYDTESNEVAVSGSRCVFSVEPKTPPTPRSCSVYGIGAVSASVEEEFTVNYRLSTCEISSGAFVITYDPECLELLEVTNGGFLNGKTAEIVTDTAGSASVTFTAEEYSESTELLSVRFKTLKNADGESEIIVSANELCDLDLVPFECTGCTTEVAFASDGVYIEDAPSMSVGAVYDAETERVIATVKLDEGSRLGTGYFVVGFDPSVLSLASFEAGFAPDNFVINDKNKDEGIIKLLISSTEDIVDALTVITLTFDVTHPCEESLTFIALEGSGISDALTEEIKLNLIDGSATVPPRHTYSSDCDTVCDICNAERYADTAHGFSGAEDTECDACGKVRVLSRIEISAKPDKLVYLEAKDALDLSGGAITLYYDDGTEGVIGMTEDMVSGFDNTVVGEQELTVLYGELTAVFTVEVTSKSLVGIEITQLPSKTEYLEGKDALDLTDGVLTLYYDNDTSREIALSEAEIIGFDNTVVGECTLTVVYSEKTTALTVVITEKSLTHIELTSLPSKTEYLEGKDTLDVTGGVITLYYNNETSAQAELLLSMVTGFDNTAVGTQTLTVSYDGIETTYDIVVIPKTLTSVELIDNGLKKEYLEAKDELDLSGGALRLYYNNDTYSDIELTADMVSGFDNAAVGVQVLTVTYEDFEDTFEIEIRQKSLESIAVTTLPTKTHYLANADDFDATGGVVTLYYNNGTSEQIELTADMVSGFSNRIVGTYTLTVTCNEKTATFKVAVDDKSLASIEVTAKPNKLIYLEGAALDLTGIVVTAHFDNDTMEVISEYIVSGYDPTPGEKTVTVTYSGSTASFTVEVKEKSPVSIKITQKPDKLICLEGEELDLTGMTVTLYYDNNTSEPISEYTVSGYDSTPGEKTITVTYGDFTASFTVEVKEKSPVSIELTSKPDKLIYLEGEELDLTGLAVALQYDNNTSDPVSEYTVNGYDSTPGEKTLTVTYGDFTATFTVEVKEKSPVSIEVTTKPDKLIYLEGDELDCAGLVVTLYYDNGTSELVSEYTVSGYDSTPGEKNVTVTYGEFSAGFTVEVMAKSPVSIEITTLPDKLIYLEGEELDCTGMAVTVYYDNDTSDILLEYSVGGYDSTPGEKTVTVALGELTASFTVEVKEKSPVSIAVTQKPDKLTYIEGAELDLTGMVVMVYYDNDTFEEITDYTVSGYDSTVGTKTVTVTYGDLTDSFEIVVRSVPASVTSSKHKVSDGYISKIAEKTTVASLLSGLNEGVYCKVFKGNAVLGSDDIVGTGMTVKIMDGDTPVASYTVIVTGDTNGDGSISVTDMIALKAHVLKKSTLSGAYASAADTNGDGGVSITDFIQVKAKILGKGTVTER